MSEAESSRPKLFYTRDHPLAGEEEPFPSPDNLFKLARSNQNAAHIGMDVQVKDTHSTQLIVDQVSSAPVVVGLLLAASIVTVVDNTTAEPLLLTWKNLLRRTGMSTSLIAYTKLFPNQSLDSYLRTVAGLRRTRGGMNGGVNDRMGGGMVPVPMY